MAGTELGGSNRREQENGRKNQQNVKRRIILSYIVKNKNKSTNILYPLLGIKDDGVFSGKTKCYLYSTCVNESIDEYNLLMVSEHLKEKDVINNKHLCNTYTLDDKRVLYVFDMTDRIHTVQHFLEGKYSLIDEREKQVILKYFNTPTSLKTKCAMKAGVPQYPHHVVLYPEYYLDDIAEEIGVDKDYMKSIGESWSRYDIVTETFDCCLTEDVINPDQLSLFL